MGTTPVGTNGLTTISGTTLVQLVADFQSSMTAADSALSSIKASVTEGSGTILTNAKAYADQRDEAYLSNSKTYTDQQVAPDRVRLTGLEATAPTSGASAELLAGFLDSEDRETWLGARRSDGGPTEEAIRHLLLRLGVSVQSSAGYMAVLTDPNGLLTDLAIRDTDGQVDDFVIQRWAKRLAPILGVSGAREYMMVDGKARLVTGDVSRVALWGSSTMQLGGPEIAAEFERLGADTVYQGGASGELGSQTVARIGSAPALLTFPSDTIPASGAVTVTSSNMPAGEYLEPFAGTVGGVHGTLSSTVDTLTFTRTTAGSATITTAGAPLIPDLGTQYRDAVNVINLNKNGYSLVSAEETIAMIDAAFDYMEPVYPRTLVLGHFINTNVWPDSDAGLKIEQINAYCRDKYGPLFIDQHAFITSPKVWEITGITPTQGDLDQQAFQGYGVKPDSISMDHSHFNDAGDSAIAWLIGQAIENLNWYGA